MTPHGAGKRLRMEPPNDSAWSCQMTPHGAANDSACTPLGAANDSAVRSEPPMTQLAWPEGIDSEPYKEQGSDSPAPPADI